MALEVDITKKLDGFFMHMQFRAEQEIFAILGASGCGKSMTLKCIAGIEKPDEGRIVLDGKVLFDSEKKINLPPQKRKVGRHGKTAGPEPDGIVDPPVSAGRAGEKDPGTAFRRTETARRDGTDARSRAGADSARRAVFSARYLSEMAVGAGNVQTSEGGRKTGHLRITQPR